MANSGITHTYKITQFMQKNFSKYVFFQTKTYETNTYSK